jgi:ParB family transcriptional regulator, chromosome partitioning protein
VAERTRGLGPRGLAAMLSPTAPAENGRESHPELRDVPVELIVPNPRQPRRTFDEGSLLALADSLRERGVLQPVLVRPLPGGTYELIAGERRWRAARMAGFDSVPALVRPHDDVESLELALVENMAREDLNPVEEAQACALLVEELGLTREDVGRRVGRSRVAVSNLLRLLDLPDEVLELLAVGDLSEGHGRALLLASDHGDRRRLARTAALEGWTVRQTEARAREAERQGAQAPGANGSRRRRRLSTLHPDQAEAAERLGDALARATGADVHVTPRADGCRVTLAFPSLAEALSLAERLGAAEPV